MDKRNFTVIREKCSPKINLLKYQLDFFDEISEEKDSEKLLAFAAETLFEEFEKSHKDYKNSSLIYSS